MTNIVFQYLVELLHGKPFWIELNFIRDTHFTSFIYKFPTNLSMYFTKHLKI